MALRANRELVRGTSVMAVVVAVVVVVVVVVVVAVL